FGDDPCPDGVSALTDGEAKFLLHGDGGDKFCRYRNRVSRHDHLNVLRKLDNAGNVGGPEVELGAVAVKKGCVAPSLFFGQDVDFAFKLRVGSNGSWFG